METKKPKISKERLRKIGWKIAESLFILAGSALLVGGTAILPELGHIFVLTGVGLIGVSSLIRDWKLPDGGKRSKHPWSGAVVMWSFAVAAAIFAWFMERSRM